MADSRRSSTREALLRAASEVVRAEGVSSLSLEAVARRAGVSKGGLLYHFPTKDTLLTAMVTDLLERFEADLEQKLQQDAQPAPGRWLRAFVRATFATPQPDFDLTAGVLAAAAADPLMLAPFRGAFKRWQEHAENDGLDPAHATLIRLAADGLWFADLLDVAPPTGSLRTRVLSALLQLTHKPAE